MFYFVGGAPRTGKSILGQQIATKLNIGWISTDLLVEILTVKNEDGIKTEWNAAPEAISNDAEWFFPYLEHFVSKLTSHTESYVYRRRRFSTCAYQSAFQAIRSKVSISWLL